MLMPSKKPGGKRKELATLKAKEFLRDKHLPFVIMKSRIDFEFEYHNHEFFEFFYVAEGRFLHNLNGEERMVRKGDVVLMNPKHRHSFRPLEKEPAETIQALFMPSFIGVDTKLLKKVKGFIELVYLEPFYDKGFKTFHLFGMSELKIRSLLFELLYEFQEKPKGYEIAIKTKLLDLLISLVRIYETEKKKNPAAEKLSKKAKAITDSIAYIDTHFKEDLKLEDISLNKADLTKEYFCTVFKKITGRTFTEYVTELRIAEAKRLLSSGSMAVTEICFDSGFKDLSHFTRTFKLVTGYNPSAFRKKQQK